MTGSNSNSKPVQKAKPKGKGKGKRSPGTASATSFAAAAYASGQRIREPRVKAGQASTRIQHRELIGNIAGTTTFTVNQNLALNPGIAATFPWLSTQASGWEQYRFHRLDFEYVTRSPTSATGDVFLSPDYDVLDAPPSTEQEVSTYRDTTEDACWKDQCCKLDPSAMFPIGPRKYVRDSSVATADLKTYDAGRLYVVTNGQANTNSIGKLWVNYDVEFFVPQTTSSSGVPVNQTFAQFNLSANQSLSTGTEATLVFDEVVSNDLGITNSSGVFTLPRGNWRIQSAIGCSGGTAAATMLVEIQKNSAALSPPNTQQSVCAAVSTHAGELVNEAFVSSGGSDTARVRVTYTSSTGTLVATGDRCKISFQLV